MEKLKELGNRALAIPFGIAVVLFCVLGLRRSGSARHQRFHPVAEETQRIITRQGSKP